MAKKSRQKPKCRVKEKSFRGEIKSTFHNFKGLSAVKNCLQPESAPLIIDMIPCIQNSPPRKILNTSGNVLDSLETTPSSSTQMNLIETPKKVNDAMKLRMVRKLSHSANLFYCMILIKRPCTHLFVNVI